jgi:hypothetical protein
MPHLTALPFVLRRQQSVIAGREITSTKEEAFGLVRLEPDQLIIQWSTARMTSRVGREIRVDRELDPVREVAIPLSGLAGARIQFQWRVGAAIRWPPRWMILLQAADLRAFEGLAGVAGLVLEHPAELSLELRRSDRGAGSEFVGELELALADQALKAAEEHKRLPDPDRTTSG